MQSLIASAGGWARAGVKIVPVKLGVESDGKKTVAPLWKWRTERYPGFDKLKWNGANSYGVVLGKTPQGWLACVDCDHDTDHDAYTTLTRAFPDLTATYIERTPNGFHFFMYIDKPGDAGNINIKTKNGTELHVNGIVFMAPSSYEAGKYEVYNAVAIMKVPDFYQQYQRAFDTLKTQVDVAYILKGVLEGERNDAAIQLASWYRRRRNLKKEETRKKLREWNNRNTPPLSIEELNNVVDSAYRNLEPYHYYYVNEPYAARKKQEKIAFRPFLELEDGHLCEQAFDGKDIFYLVYEPEEGSITKATRINAGPMTYAPIDNEEARRQLILLPSAVEEYGDDTTLMKEIKAFLNRWHEATDEETRMLDVFYVFLTYIKDLVPQLPYRRMLAPWGRGKSAWLEALGWICYRGIILAGSDTDKAVVRRLHNWQGTALIDEADFGQSSLYAFMTKTLNIGYDRKTGFYQRCHDDDPNKVLTYNVYGPKILATRKKYMDPALESRCLTSIGRQNLKPVPLFRMDTFVKEAQSLRNKLILWRFRNYRKIKEASKSLEDATIVKEVYGDGNIASRIKQIILPLWLIGGDQIKRTLQKLAQTIDERMKVEDPDYLLQLKAKKAVCDIIDRADKVNVGNIVNVLRGEGGQKLYEIKLTDISQQALVNEGYAEDKISRSEKISMSKQLKEIFETNLGFTVKIGRHRARVVQIPIVWVRPEDLPSHFD